MISILIVTNELLYTCGISKQLKYFLQGMKAQKEFEISIFCGGGEAVDDYRNLCKEIFIDERIKHENRSYLNYIISFMKIFRLAKKNQYNIIHSHNHYAANICSKVSYFTDIVDVQTNHGILPVIGRLNHFSAEYIVCINDHIVEYLERNELRPLSKIKLIYNGIPVHNIQEETSNQKFRVIAASRMVPEKGLDAYIKAVTKLPDSIRREVEFLIAGKGEQANELKKLNDELNAGVNFIGEVKDLIEVLKTTKIFVFTTLLNEGFPMTLIEAALTKNLILSSKFSSMNSVFSSDLASLLFERGNSLELANLLQRSIENFPDYENIVESLYKKVKEKFNADKMISELMQFYKSVVV
jgi:glycosyltransferase involved in cell wall biosynthesis